MLTEELDRRGEAAYNAYQAARNQARKPGATQADLDKEYEAWKAWNTIKPLIIANGGEEIPPEHPLHAIYKAIRKHCIKGGFPSSMRLFFIPEDEQQEEPNTAGIYKEGIIRINKRYYLEHGTDEYVINTMFHEMMHGFCDCKPLDVQIKDTEGEYHLPAFKEACEANGGTCYFVDSRTGYSNARLTPDRLELVRAELKKAM